MALECSLILSANLSPETLLSRAFPEAALRPDFEHSEGVWVADLGQRMGFVLNLCQGSQGYFEAEAGEDLWTWEPYQYLNLGFRFDKEFSLQTARQYMLAIVTSVLGSGGEDAALILNGDTLLLRRIAGQLTRFSAGGFWDRLKPSDIPTP